MTEFNSYPVFVADQVLRAEHLNEIVNYLDEQDRLTRNKLIGIGIVCGLELKVDSTQIMITKGCGVTSAGYLIIQDEVTLKYYHPYSVPTDFSPKYKSLYENWEMWELLTAQQSLDVEDVESIEENAEFMSDKIVVLLLEMRETPLKNCVDTDCDDKGEKIEFAVKPLLVPKRDLDKFIKEVGHIPGGRNVAINAPKYDVQLRRFNVPVGDLTSADLVLNAFLQLVDEPLLKQLADALNYCYEGYKPVLFEEEINPFTNIFDHFKSRLSAVKSFNPLFVQYFYDWIDDLIKSYNEFRKKVFDVQVMCCPDEDLFPLHLMLGEATKSTSVDAPAAYRHYFIYSPLFNQQKELLEEVQLLFRKMKLLAQKYLIANPNTFSNAVVRITPSKYLDKPLSDRCIPYYYNSLEVFQSWSWEKTRRGVSNTNLSYHANQYNTADAVVNPLKYDIERFNFFRVEGHIGKNYNQALSTIISQRNQFNLPFEVVALSTATVARYIASDDKTCLFKDLDALYQVIIAELMCRFGDLACMIGQVPYNPQFIVGVIGDFTAGLSAGASTINTNVAVGNTFASTMAGFSALNISPEILAALANFTITPKYKRGDFFRNHCTIKKGSIGETYLSLVDKGHSFVKPSPTSNWNINIVYAHFFHFIDSVENVMGASWPYELRDFTSSTFNSRFAALTDASQFIAANNNSILEVAKELNLDTILRRFPALIYTCFDKRLDALKKEYTKRHTELQALVNLMNYFKKHPGMEHKAGVPKGGTFIIVYHETPPQRPVRPIPPVLTHVPGAILENLSTNLSFAARSNIDDLLTAGAVKDPELLSRFQVALGRFVDTCKDMDEETKLDIKDVLITIPSLTVPTKFKLQEFSVIADFYLPYLCCSDCAPIAYVLPKEQVDVLSIGIKPTAFCNNDDRTYPVLVKPEGGVLSASNGGVQSGTFEFRPSGLVAGVNKLTYTMPDGRSTSVDVLVTQGFEVGFQFEIEDGITVKFTPNNVDGREIKWDFGDGATSTEGTPIHTYQFNEEKKEFTVRLSVTDGPCFDTFEETFVLQKPVNAEFFIKPRLFCSYDKTSYEFVVMPKPSGLDEIVNKDKLRLQFNSGVVSFSPADQVLKQLKDFNFEYKGIPLSIRIVVPNADFFIELRSAANDISLLLRAKQENADSYDWTILIDEGRKLRFSESKVDIMYSKVDMRPEQTLNIVLTTKYAVPGVDCFDSKPYVITPKIFKLHLNAGEFDNLPT